MARSKKAIARLDEKALRGGGKSEDQPFSVFAKCSRCKGMRRNLIFVGMKHESIVVVYDSCQAIAEEIADKLGAETISVQSINNRQIENCQSFVLALEFMADGSMTPHWQWACQTLRGASLSGKNFAVLVALGNKLNHDADKICHELRERHAHIVGEQLYAETPQCNLENWICSVSPNL